MKELLIGMVLFLRMLCVSAEEQTNIASDWRTIEDQLWSLIGPVDNKSLEAFNNTFAAFDSAISQLQPDQKAEKKEALEAKGNLFFSMGRYQDAIDAFDAAIATADPKVPQEAMNALFIQRPSLHAAGQVYRGFGVV